MILNFILLAYAVIALGVAIYAWETIGKHQDELVASIITTFFVGILWPIIIALTIWDKIHGVDEADDEDFDEEFIRKVTKIEEEAYARCHCDACNAEPDRAEAFAKALPYLECASVCSDCVKTECPCCGCVHSENDCDLACDETYPCWEPTGLSPADEADIACAASAAPIPGHEIEHDLAISGPGKDIPAHIVDIVPTKEGETHEQ